MPHLIGREASVRIGVEPLFQIGDCFLTMSETQIFAFRLVINVAECRFAEIMFLNGHTKVQDLTQGDTKIKLPVLVFSDGTCAV